MYGYIKKLCLVYSLIFILILLCVCVWSEPMHQLHVNGFCEVLGGAEEIESVLSQGLKGI